MGRRIGHVLLLAFLMGTRSLALSAQNTNSDSARIARLAALGRVFGVVKYFHPAFLHRAVPWDSITIMAIDQVNRATTAEEYALAVRGMLAQLHDPATYVRKTLGEQGADGTLPKPTARWEVDGRDSTLVISIPRFNENPSSLQRGEGDAGVLLDSLSPTVRRTPRVIFDLRGPRAHEWGVSTFAFVRGMNEALTETSLTLPNQRMRMHEGYRPIDCNACDAWDGMYEKSGDIISGTSAVPDAVRRTVFIANAWSDIPPVAFALRRARHGAIVIAGSPPELAAGATTFRVPLGDSLEAVIRTSELADVVAIADTALSGDAGANAPMRVAMAYARGSSSTAARTPAPLISIPPDDPYSAMRFPAFPYRILAAYRLWNAINYFYPYKHLLAEDWGATLPRSVGWASAARDSIEYGLALQRLAVATHDSHSGVTRNAGLRQLIGTAAPAVQLQYIDDQPVVITIGDEPAARASGLAVGDVIVSVDGLTAKARRSRFAAFIPHSTPQALDAVASRALLRGADSSVARLTVSGRDNRIRQVEVPRRAAVMSVWNFSRPTPILRILPGNIGYADLTRLTAPMVDSMFEMFRHTRGIIFDDRGYPHETGWSIASRLTDRSMIPVGQWRRPVVMSPDTLVWDMTGGTGYAPAPTPKWKYHGKTVVLVDEYAVSQAESLIMLLTAVNNTTVIGSPVMGANGSVVAVPLPGGMFGNFAEEEALRPNGQQWQRIGPHLQVLVRPTLKGIRAGRDEVLERAIRFLNQ